MSVLKWLSEQNRDEKFYTLIEKCIGNYVTDLINIFNKAPKLEKNLYVFRGTKTFYYGTEGSKVFTNMEFMSTSISPRLALNFTRDECYFTQIKLRPGSRVIFIEPVSQHWGELEVLIPPGNKFKVFKDKIRRFVAVPNPDNIEDSNYKKFACTEPVSRKSILFTLMETI